jgi:hypothetical protein
MKKPLKKLLTGFFLINLFPCTAFALDIGNVIAYPVPFSPDRHILTIKDNAPSPAQITKLKIEIFDINGDCVFSRDTLPSGVILMQWSGRNNSGRKVRPGLYIIKVTAENASGDYGKKIIKILVNH